MEWNFWIGIIFISSPALISGQAVDIALILDGSGSIFDQHPPMWESQISLAVNIIRNLNIGSEDARVAVVTIAETGVVEWHLDKYFDRSSLIDAIQSLIYRGRTSNIADGLMVTWKEVFNGKNGDRDGVTNVAVTFSDGWPTVNVGTTATTAQDVKAAGILLEAVAIGKNPDKYMLKYMSNGQVYNSTELATDQNIFANFVARLREDTGQSPSDPCASNPCMNGGICSSSENPYKWRFYCYCPRKSLVKDYGGRLCQIYNPCDTCPKDRLYKCFRSLSDDSGRYCFDNSWNLLD